MSSKSLKRKKSEDISNWVSYGNRMSIYNRWKIVTFEVESVKPTGSTHKAHLFDLNHESIRCTDSAALVETNGSWAGSIYWSGSTQFQMNLTQKLISKCPKPQSPKARAGQTAMCVWAWVETHITYFILSLKDLVPQRPNPYTSILSYLYSSIVYYFSMWDELI